MDEQIIPSWEIFDICPTCGVGEGVPCCNLLRSTPKNLIRTTTPHKGRRMLKSKVYEP